MVEGNLLGCAIVYVVNKFLVEGLANNRAFQRFAVKTSKALENINVKAQQTKEEIAEQMKDASRNFDAFKRQ